MEKPHLGSDVISRSPGSQSAPLGARLSQGSWCAGPIWHLGAPPPSGLEMSPVPGSQSALEAGHPQDAAWPQSSAPRGSHSGPCLAEPVGCSVGEEGIHRAWIHLRPVCADRAWPPLQWTLNSVLSACGNDKGRTRPPPGRGILKKRKQTLITPASGQCLSECNHRLIGY